MTKDDEDAQIDRETDDLLDDAARIIRARRNILGPVLSDLESQWLNNLDRLKLRQLRRRCGGNN